MWREMFERWVFVMGLETLPISALDYASFLVPSSAPPVPVCVSLPSTI